MDRYGDVFPRNRIKILLYEQLLEDSTQFLHTITDFLGVDRFNDNYTRNRVNSTRVPRNRIIETAIAKSGEWLRNNNLYSIKRTIDRIKIVSAIKALNTRKDVIVTKERLNRDSIDHIYSILGEDIQYLSKWTGRNMSFWFNDSINKL